MQPDPDDPTRPHSTAAMRIPAWAATSRLGRAYARRRVTRIIDRELTRTGYTRTGPICTHITVTDGLPIALSHFSARDAIAAKFDEATP